VLIAGAIAGAVIGTTALAGCSSASSHSTASSAQRAAAPAGQNSAAVPAAGGVNSGFAGSSSSSSGAAADSPESATSARLIPAAQSIIYTAQLSVRAKSVSAALTGATRIVTAVGGYVSSENATANPDHPAQATATATFKIPVTAYQATLASLDSGSVGTQLSLRQQAQDVTQQVADVDSQVKSDEAALAQLRGLLTHAGSVQALLDVQNQINSEEGQLEAMQAQQKALDGETAYATVTVTIVGPKALAAKPKKAAPPPGLGSGASGGWHAFTLTIDWLLAIIGAVAPFAAAIAVLSVIGWWIRRRLRRAPAPAPAPAAEE
jgi:predicted transcriptional regulator